MQARTRAQGIELGASSPEEFRAFLAGYIATWTKAIREMGIKID